MEDEGNGHYVAAISIPLGGLEGKFVVFDAGVTHGNVHALNDSRMGTGLLEAQK